MDEMLFSFLGGQRQIPGASRGPGGGEVRTIHLDLIQLPVKLQPRLKASKLCLRSSDLQAGASRSSEELREAPVDQRGSNLLRRPLRAFKQ